jgi:branched-chain amino acid aminotransferase
VVDGVLADAREATVSALDRGLLYGDGVFESLRTRRGAPFRLDAHLDRLERSASLARLPFPDVASLRADVARALAASDASADGERYVRVMLTRGRGRLSPRIEAASGAPATRVVIAGALALPPSHVYERGLRVACVSGVASASGGDVTLGHVKALPYLGHALALAEAADRGADDALLVAPDGAVLEGATSGLFVVRGGRLRTTPRSALALPSLSAEWVADLAAAAGLAVDRALVFPSDLYRADEVFLTSSVRGVIGVVGVDGVVVGTGRPGPITRALADAFDEAAFDAAALEPA